MNDFKTLIEDTIDRKIDNIESIKFDEEKKIYTIEYTTQFGYRTNTIKFTESGEYVEENSTFRTKFTLTGGQVIQTRMYRGDIKTSILTSLDDTLMYKLNKELGKQKFIANKPGISYLTEEPYFDSIKYIVCSGVYASNDEVISEFEMEATESEVLSKDNIINYVKDFLLDSSLNSWSKQLSKKILITDYRYVRNDNIEAIRYYLSLITPKSECYERAKL